MKTITTTEDLAAFCQAAAKAPYVTVDTEFLRERTYYSKLCLIQLAFPGKGDENAVLVDPLVDGLDLEPLLELFRNTAVVKVFHAARQDLEIFFIDHGVIPDPLFDTQVAAMVCGFGEQVGYETLVKRIAKQALDKSSRFTDWSRRPLTEAQKKYALADVTHLRVIYEYLAAELERTGRARWVAEELAVLTDPETYITRPEDAWQRVKTRTNSPRFLAVVRELAEETGVDGVCGPLMGWIERTDIDYHHVILDFEVTVLSDDWPVAGDDAAEAAWVPLGEIGGLDLVDGLAAFLVEHGGTPPLPLAQRLKTETNALVQLCYYVV